MKTNTRLIRAQSRLERRLFLKALGLGLATPLAAKLARYATAAPGAAPKRFMIMYVPHGIAPEHFNPQVAQGNPTSFDLDKTNESILGPLQAYKKWVNVYQGFKYPDLNGTHEGIVNCLSGANTTDINTPRTTLDQVIAKGIGKQALILGACSHLPYGIDLHGMLFWDGTPIDPEKSPVKVADSLFGGGSGPTPTNNADAALQSALLDLTAAEISDLQTAAAGLTAEQTKLQAHLNAVQTIKAQGSGGGTNSCTSKPNLPTVEKVRAASAGQVVDPSGGNDYFYQEANFKLLLQAQLEVTAQAFVCGAAQVVGLMPMYATCDFDFSFVGGTQPAGGWSHHNGLSHTPPQPTGNTMSPLSIANEGDPAIRASFAKAQRWFYQQLADNLVSVLATTPDPLASDGSMVLDNSLIYVMSEIGDGNWHTRVSQVEWYQAPEYLPMVSIGGCAGAIKAGQVLSLPITTDGAKSRPAVDLYLTFAKAMGVSDATFPGSTGIVEGVLA